MVEWNLSGLSGENSGQVFCLLFFRRVSANLQTLRRPLEARLDEKKPAMLGFRNRRRLTAKANSRRIRIVLRVAKVLLVAALAGFWSASVVRCQVPEKPPQPTNDDDWKYVSPGPAKCVEAGNVYLHRGALAGALSRFQEALKDDPHYAPAYLGLGKVYERMKQNFANRLYFSPSTLRRRATALWASRASTASLAEGSSSR